MSTGSKSAEFTTHVPQDTRGLRNNGLDLLNSLFGGQGQANISKIFGDLGVPTTALQRQSTNGISQFLNQPAPEQRAFDMSQGALGDILGSKPGQGIIDALQPTFQRNLASANQEGGRFGSANALLRGKAVEDFNLLGAQAAQQGQQNQIQAAQILNLLGANAGQNPFSRLMGGAQVGASDAAQADLGTQRMMQIIGTLLSGGLGAGVGAPVVQTKGQTPGWGQQYAQMLSQSAGQIAGAMGGGGGGGGGGFNWGGGTGYGQY